MCGDAHRHNQRAIIGANGSHGEGTHHQTQLAFKVTFRRSAQLFRLGAHIDGLEPAGDARRHTGDDRCRGKSCCTSVTPSSCRDGGGTQRIAITRATQPRWSAPLHRYAHASEPITGLAAASASIGKPPQHSSNTPPPAHTTLEPVPTSHLLGATPRRTASAHLAGIYEPLDCGAESTAVLDCAHLHVSVREHMVPEGLRGRIGGGYQSAEA